MNLLRGQTRGLFRGQTGGRLRSRSLPCLYRIIAWTFPALAASKFFHRPGITAYIQAFNSCRSHCPLSLRAPLQILSPLLPAPSRAPILPETGILNQRMHMYPAPIPPALLHTPSVLVLPLRHRGISAREIHLPDSPSLLPVRNPVQIFSLCRNIGPIIISRGLILQVFLPSIASHEFLRCVLRSQHGSPGLLPRNSASLAARSAWRPRDQRHGPAAPPADGVFLPFSPHVSHGGGSYLLSHTHMPFRCPV